MAVLETVITNVYNAINAGAYFRSTTEMQTAISLANTQLYQRFRGNMAQYQKNSPKAVLNFGETTITLDSLAELFQIIPLTGNPLIVSLADQVVDIVENLDVQYVADGPYYGAKILPPNQWATMNQNAVVPPEDEFPYARFVRLTDPEQYQQFEVLPSDYTGVEASVYILPPEPQFTLTESGGPIPTITVTQDLLWTPEKIPALVFLTIQNLGFTLQNGVLIQGSQSQLQQQL
jgi:hypothetical protein